MPAAEVADRNSYELAFHILPTVAEGEVSGEFDAIKSLITTNGGELGDEEAPERFELAYDVFKHIDTKNRKFSSAYFGWVRFVSEAVAIDVLNEAMVENSNILRHMVLRLSKVEEAEPFNFHDALEDQKVVTVDAEAPKVVSQSGGLKQEVASHDSGDKLNSSSKEVKKEEVKQEIVEEKKKLK